jgi:hypothetical protein
LDSTGGCVGDNGSGVYDDGYNYFMHPTQARQSFDNVSARMTQSNLSCGSPWWPSLTSSIFNGSGFNITVDGGSWELIGRDEDYVDAIRPATYCYTNYNGIQGTISGNVSYFLRANVDIPEPLINAYCSQETRAYSTNECLQGKDALGNFPSQTQQGICACSQIEQGACITSGRRHTCYCQDLERQSNGTIKNITIKYTSSNTWADQQLRYCLGLDKLSIGGVDIQRYGNSSAACDEIVPQFCFSTAWVTANPELSKGCGCLIEEKKLQVQFAGLDLPVQCFSSLCSNSDPNIYRTVEQNSGCDARICTQIISINGSDIASQGFQTILCNGELYSTQTVNPSQTPVPTITPSTSGGVQLDAVFFISLGLLVFMVLLLVVYGIRKAVLQKRTQTRDRDLITQALQTAIGQK